MIDGRIADTQSNQLPNTISNMIIYANQISLGQPYSDIQKRFPENEIVIDPTRLSDDPSYPEHVREILRKQEEQYSQILHVSDVYAWGIKGNMTFWIGNDGSIIGWSWYADALTTVSREQVEYVIAFLMSMYGEYRTEEDDETSLLWNTSDRKIALCVEYDTINGMYELTYNEQKA